jgi:hypothetical protein
MDGMDDIGQSNRLNTTALKKTIAAAPAHDHEGLMALLRH